MITAPRTHSGRLAQNNTGTPNARDASVDAYDAQAVGAQGGGSVRRREQASR